MSKIENFINQKQISKTLRFRLIPQGKTTECLTEKMIVENDERLSQEYQKLKKIITSHHKSYISSRLKDVELTDLQSFAELYQKKSKTDGEKAQQEELLAKMKAQVNKLLVDTKEYDNLFGSGIIKDLEQSEEINDIDREVVELFDKKSTYSLDFQKNLENIYTNEDKSTEICFRLFNQNINKFLDNCLLKDKISPVTEDCGEKIQSELLSRFGWTLEEVFDPLSYNKLLTQEGIDAYNQILGGVALENGVKIQGLNEYINLYCQQRKVRLPQLQILYKQILSESTSQSFVLEKFENDDGLLNAINSYIEFSQEKIEKIGKVFEKIGEYDLNGIYIESKNASGFSNAVFGDWSFVKTAWEQRYDADKTEKQKQKSTYFEERDKVFKKSLISLAEVQSYGEENCVVDYVKTEIAELKQGVEDATRDYQFFKFDKAIMQDEESVLAIKKYLDAVMDYYHFAQDYLCKEEGNFDTVFYGELSNDLEELSYIIPLYNKTRNYLTQKPFSKEKFKLCFDRGEFLEGWAKPDEYNKSEAHLLEKDGQYYVLITAETLKKEDIDGLSANVSATENTYHLEYIFQKPDNKNTPRLFIRSKKDSFAPMVKECNLPIESVIEDYDNGWFKTEYKKKDPVQFRKSLTKVIDYFKLGFSRHPSYKCFDFAWKPSDQYENISDFYKDVANSCYTIKKELINYDALQKLVDEGKVYLFRIYSKDFSTQKKAKGTDNLHTLYFKMLFDDDNLKDVVFKLSGGSEMFFRKKSLQPHVTHPKNQPIANKNALNEKKTSVFEYDLIKDRRFTLDEFFIHIPVCINFKAGDGKGLNESVKAALKNSGKNYVIGIDRGERNLLSICVVDQDGKIVEQSSANVTQSVYNGVEYKTDYHALLVKKEEERKQARANWSEIGNIKNLKDGYLSVVIHDICRLVEKYDAIVVMEDLNGGFKNSRAKIERQVYQKFETMLVSKLSYLAFKNRAANSVGGLLKAYQLADTDLKKGKQNGFIFYIPAAYTSKIDPQTGFINLLRPKYESEQNAKDFVQKFDSITYDAQKDAFAFSFDYDNFERTEAVFKKKWTVWSNGSRIITFRNKEKNNEWDYKTVEPTQSFKHLFAKFGVDIKKEIKAQILSISGKEFWETLLRLISTVLQMRNSNPNTGDDYIISPVANEEGVFFDSRNYHGNDAPMPVDADANGAFHIALKGLMLIEKIKKGEEDLFIKNEEFFKMTQGK